MSATTEYLAKALELTREALHSSSSVNNSNNTNGNANASTQEQPNSHLASSQTESNPVNVVKMV